jgi:MFS family permease
MKKAIYYILHWTWALPINIVAGIVCLVCMCFKCPVRKYRNAVEIIVPWNFGGLEIGMFFIRGKDCESVAPHEYGHTIQTLWWGLLGLLVISGPSAARYWIREQKTQAQKYIFAVGILVCAFILGAIVGIIGIYLWYPLFIFALCFIAYAGGLFAWLCTSEIPKYAKPNPPKYDDIWFEGQATRLGNRANSGEWDWL